jgi:hypothetical protein
VADWAFARRRIGQHVPINPHQRIEGRPLLGNTPVNTHHNDCATLERERVFYEVCSKKLS